MNIDNKLISFQEQVGVQLGTIESSKNSLQQDVDNLKKINDSVNTSLASSFKGDGGDSIKAEIEFINQTVSKIQDSIENELAEAIEKCKSLNDGIDELKSLLEEYNSAKSLYSSLSSDDKGKQNAYYNMTNASNKFQKRQNELLEERNNILNLDSSLSILKQFSTVDDSVTNNLAINSGFTAKYDGSVQFSSVYYESDGVIYQKVIPICKDGVYAIPDEQYTIIYNKENLLAADANAGEEAIKFLTAKLNGSSTTQYLWDYCSGNVKTSYKAVANVMNQVLKDTYKSNNASTIVDYAAIAAMVANNSLVHFGYDSNSAEKTYGFEQVLAHGGKLDCIGLVRWCYSQGLYETNVVKPGQNAETYYGKGESITPLNILDQHSVALSSMSMEERANIEIGSVLSRPCYENNKISNYHVGIVIGHTTDESGNPALIVAQSSNPTVGANNRVYLLKDLATEKNTWTNVSSPEIMNMRVLYGSNESTRIRA